MASKMTAPDWVKWHLEQCHEARDKGDLSLAMTWIDIALIKLKSSQPRTIGASIWAHEEVTRLKKYKETLRAYKTAQKVFGEVPHA